jgi:hypothetical protein
MYVNMLDVSSTVFRIDVSYKTIKRLYSDEEVVMALRNLHVLLLKKKGVERSDASGDGTGYSLTISKHYESVAKELKEKAKEQQDSVATAQQPASTADAKDGLKKRAFAYVFMLLDLSTLDVTLDTARLDRYYRSSACVDSLGGAKVFVITEEQRHSERLLEVEVDDEGVRDEHDQVPGAVLQEGELRVKVRGGQEDARMGDSSEKGRLDRVRTVLHGAVAQPVQSSDALNSAPHPR